MASKRNKQCRRARLQWETCHWVGWEGQVREGTAEIMRERKVSAIQAGLEGGGKETGGGALVEGSGHW